MHEVLQRFVHTHLHIGTQIHFVSLSFQKIKEPAELPVRVGDVIVNNT